MDMQPPEIIEEKQPQGPDLEVERALACLLDYALGASVALPIHAGVELVEQPRVVRVPGMPTSCMGLFRWQGRQLPLIDLHRHLDSSSATDVASFTHVLVVAYQNSPGTPIEYGGLCAPYLVRMIEVSNSQQCTLGPSNEVLNALSISCFVHQGRVVPVIDPARLFARPLSTTTV